MKVTPTVFFKFGKKAVDKYLKEGKEKSFTEDLPILELK